jgi:flagellar hook-associated protein 1 FlgK
MTATFLSFQTASRALAASKANIDLTGNNIANVNTEGYSRQRVDLTSISMSGYTQRFTVPGASIGLGVDVSQVSQTRDPFLDSRFRIQNAEANQYNVILSGLSDLENVFDEIENDGLQSELLNFTNQLQNLSQSPTSTDLGLVVRTAAQKVTQILNIYATQTEQVRQQQIYDLKNVVISNDFNTTVENIAKLNTQIRDEVTHGNEPNELYDTRNMLIDKLSGMANIRVTSTPEQISESLIIENLGISIYDASTGTSIGVVSNGLYNTLSVNQQDENLKIEINSSFGDHPKDVTSFLTGGSIKGYLDVINGKGTYADTSVGSTDNTFRGALYYKETMNTFASNFAATLNNLNNPTNDPTKTQTLFKSSDGQPIGAGNIKITDEWADSSSQLVTTTSASTTTTGGSDNVLRMISALSNNMTFYKDPSSPAPSGVVFEGTVNQYMSGLIGELALDTELNANFASTATNVLYSLSDSRDSISGVSLDEEGVNLLAYQKSYNAAARYFTVLDEAVNTIINNMGIVGR